MNYSPTPKITKKQVKIENILITYDEPHQSIVKQVFNNINKTYAAVHLFTEYNDDAIEECRNNILLSKRTIKFLFLLENHSDSWKRISWDKWFHLGQSPQTIDQPNITIVIKEEQQKESLTQRVIKKLHLDFVWLGIGSRLGTSVPDFLEGVKTYEPYQDFQNKFINYFLIKLDEQLESFEESGTGEENQKQLYSRLEICQKDCKNYLIQMNEEIEDIVCHCYNERIAISGLTYHNFYKLLKTRNYFKLIWIEEPASSRYRYFKQIISDAKLVNLNKWVESNIQNFLFLDDYFYQNYQQRVSYEANFVINKGFHKESYQSLIEKNYDQIFRKFRPDFDQYFISICELLKVRGGCIKEAVGSVIVKNKRILSTGYNGTPINSINCYNGGCRICNNSSKIHTIVLSCNCIHAEYSCIIEAGISATPGCTLYTTQLPCLWCSKVIIQAMISTVVYVRTECEALRHQNEQKIFQMFKNAGVSLKQFQSGQGKFSKK